MSLTLEGSRVAKQTPPLVGRDADLGQLNRALAAAAGGAGQVILVSGEAGIGKTRLCAELCQAYRETGGQAVGGRAFPEESGIPFAALADALRGARRAYPPLWEAVRSRARVLWPVAPELAAEIEGADWSFDRPVVFEALLDAVDEAAGDQVLPWVLDDLHWADDSTWNFVQYAARRAGDLRLLLLVTYRDEEIGPAHPWWPALLRLKRDPNVRSVALSRLADGDAVRLVAAVAPALPASLTAQIMDSGAGTPLLLEELASLAGRSGTLPTVPGIVRATVRERAARLTPEERDLLDVAATAGLEVHADLLTTLRPGADFEALIAVGLLVLEDGLLRFRHPLLREAAYSDVPRARRRELHAEIARQLSGGAGRAVQHAAVHLEQAGNPGAALSALTAAAAEANETGRVGRAATLHLDAVHLAARHETLAGQRAGLEHLAIRDLFLARRWSELDPLIRAAWSGRERLAPGDRAWLASLLGLHLFWTGSVQAASALIEEELAHLERSGHSGKAAMLLCHGGYVAWVRGDERLARRNAQRALEITQGDPPGRPSQDGAEVTWRACHIHLLITSRADGDRPATIARLRDSAASARQGGLLADEARALWDAATYAASVEAADVAQQAAEQAGAWHYRHLAQMLKGAILLLEGRTAPARPPAWRCGPPTGPPRWAGWRGSRTTGTRPPISCPAPRTATRSVSITSWSAARCSCPCRWTRCCGSAGPWTPPR